MSHKEPTNYPTDLTDEQRQIFRRLLPKASGRSASQRICRRDIVSPIFYVLCSGCT
jgi:transposase